jgi:hypothetical protein
MGEEISSAAEREAAPSQCGHSFRTPAAATGRETGSGPDDHTRDDDCSTGGDQSRLWTAFITQAPRDAAIRGNRR